MISDTLLIEEQTAIQLAVNKNCPKIMNEEELSKIRVTKDNMLPSFHGWPFSKNTPYLYAINYYISLFYQNGLQKKWSDSLTSNSERNYVDFEKGILKTDASQHSIKLYGPLLMWSYGMFFSIVCFIVELVYSFCKLFASKRLKPFLYRSNNVVEIFTN